MSWNMKGYLFGACSCDWGCPCSFNARPTQGWCQGGYIWHVTQGECDGTNLAGSNFCWVGAFPGPIHEGHGTSQIILDARSSEAVRKAILELSMGQRGGPFAIFASVTETFLDPLVAPWDIKVDGLHSRAKAGEYLDLEIGPIENPVTGAREQLHLQKPTGFTSTWADLGRSLKFSINAPGLKYDHSGKYAEYSEFGYVEPVYAQPTTK